MPTAYVYAPYSSYAKVWSGHSPCNGGYQSLDCALYNSGWSSLKLFVTSNVKSVRFTRTNNCAPGCSSNLRNAVKVDLYNGYNATGCYFGWVLYGHLAWPIANGVWNLSSGNYSWGVQVGYVVPNPGNCSYYTGEHVHMEAVGGTRLPSNNNWLNQGTTAIYRFGACF